MSSSLAALVPRLAGRRILVIGDVCLDEYLIGRPERLSREAPVPVLDFTRRLAIPGAAANPARNVVALGSAAALVGVIGDDAAGQELRALLREAGIDVAGLVVDPARPTTLKTRVLADVDLRFPQQVVRLDRSVRSPLGGPIRQLVTEAIERAARAADVILVSDYRAGVLDDRMIETIRRVAAQTCRPTVVDSQGDLWRFREFTLVRSNTPDAEATLRRPLRDEADLRAATAELREGLGAESVVITRGAAGIVFRDARGFAALPASNRSEVYDAVGAGDTVIAVLALGVAAGLPLRDSVQLATAAAGIVVRRFGNAVVSPEELADAVAHAPYSAT
ncbi:MAG: bifunctional ADP-heptose synthase [Chloroflexota bacterium]|nr:bifunctional ADP-heptose synthase [Dehalococcoidia bacterium]MDW8252902.1 bifunctional ADP-heptose synthase [Chloroflexota bacterium]